MQTSVILFFLGYFRKGQEHMSDFSADYHIHSSVSPDSKESYEGIFKAAEERGLSEIMITEHYEFFPRDYHSRFFGEGYMEDYEKRFREAVAKYRGSLRIGFGIEFGQSNEDPEKAEKILEAFDFDYVIGSCHKIDNIDLSQYDYKIIDKEALLDRYLKELYRIAEAGLYDCLGHLDLPKRYAKRQGLELAISPEDERLERILRCVIRQGKGIEINTSGMRQGLSECLPSPGILKKYAALGGRIVTVGSDAHRAVDVAADLETAKSYMRTAGLEYITCYRNRKPEMIML